MVPNLTLNYSLDNVWWVDFQDDFHYVHLNRLELWPTCLMPFLFVPGLLLNILALVILIRRKMCLEHEGFVYLGATQLVNITVIAYDVIPFWISSFGQFRNVLITSDASCKVLIQLDHVLSASGWLVVAMLLGVYLRRRGARAEKRICGCSEFPAKFCTLFGAGFTTVSVFVQLVIGCLWMIPFTEFIDSGKMQICRIDLPPSYALWVFLIERLPLLVLTPVLLIALAYLSLGPEESAADSCTTAEEPSGPNAKDFGKTAIGVAVATLLLRSPLFIMKSLLPGEVLNEHWLRFDLIFYGLAMLSHLNLVVVPIVCLATLSGMRQTLASIAGRRCSDCRCARKVDA